MSDDQLPPTATPTVTSSPTQDPINPEALPDEPELEQTELPPPLVPQVMLTFLLISGRRRTMGFEPSTTVGRVKELAWNAWPSEWSTERPPSPQYLRVLYLGKILQDEETLTSLKLPLSPAPPTIVHLAIRQIPLASDDGLKKKKKRKQSSSGTDVPAAPGVEDDSTPQGGCCGCIIS